jgi:hypothetical protein
LTAAVLAIGAEWFLHHLGHPLLQGILVLVVYSVSYLLLAQWLGVGEAAEGLYRRLGLRR